MTLMMPWEEPHDQGVEPRARANPQRFQTEQDADRYAVYVAMGWREPEPQDVGRVVFNRSFKKTDANLIIAREILRNSYLSRLGDEAGGVEQANVYFDQAIKTRPEAAWEIDSKKIWHGEHIENLSDPPNVELQYCILSKNMHLPASLKSRKSEY